MSVSDLMFWFGTSTHDWPSTRRIAQSAIITARASGALRNIIGCPASLPLYALELPTAKMGKTRWNVHDLLAFHRPPPRWTPPIRRGRRSRATQAPIARWCT